MTRVEFDSLRKWIWKEIQTCEDMLLAQEDGSDWLRRWGSFYEGRINALRACAARLGIICPVIRWGAP